MRKFLPSFLIVLFLLVCLTAFSQKSIKALIGAEKAFASFTESHTIRDGFLQFMDSAGIIFRQGKAVNALEFFQQQKPGPAILSWWPAFAVISASGDLGITSGPYELRAKSLEDTVSGRGSFSSAWRINAQGVWKNMVDLGVSYTTKNHVANEIQETVLSPKTAIAKTVLEDVLAIDKKFNEAMREKNSTAFTAYLSTDSWLNLDGVIPIKNVKEINTALMNIPSGIILTSQSGNISAVGDLAYVYGSVTNGDKKENYLRAWVFRNDKWQVIMQTIKW